MPSKPKAPKASVLIAVIANLPTGPRVQWTADVDPANAGDLDRATARAIAAATKHGCSVDIKVTPCVAGVGSAPTVLAAIIDAPAAA